MSGSDEGRRKAFSGVVVEYFLTRLCLHKGLSFLYAIAFLIAINQYRALVGKKGILPLESFVKKVRFWKAPSIFFWRNSDAFVLAMSWLGFLLSLFALMGFSEQFGLIVSMGTWFLLWVLYQSFVNVGQVFYGFGWEILLLEAGFLAIFLGDNKTVPSVEIIWLYRWLLFRVMFGAGLIKIRGDRCWKDLSALTFHYETQPLPGPLSRFFHRSSLFLHKMGVVFTHFVELVVPFFLFWPKGVACVAGLITAIFQGVLFLSGNLSWLNCITFVLCFSCFSDSFLSVFLPKNLPVAFSGNVSYEVLTFLVTLFILYLSIKPIRNLFSCHQIMNGHFDCLRLVNTYGAFGSVTRERREIIIEGTLDQEITENTRWLAYEFRGKPGLVTRRPPQVSPYHYKIDWQMWFAAMSPHQHHPWFSVFISKILEGDQAVLSLLKNDPFQGRAPHFVRAQLYVYHFAPINNPERAIWERTYVGPYFPASFLMKLK